MKSEEFDRLVEMLARISDCESFVFIMKTEREFLDHGGYLCVSEALTEELRQLREDLLGLYQYIGVGRAE